MDIAVEVLVQQEPWRMNQGQPANLLDPTWQGEARELCDGKIEHEANSSGHTGWWICQGCGFCSRSTTPLHRRAQHPADYYRESLEHFYTQRSKEGVPEEVARQQAHFIAGVALRYVTALPAERFREYVQDHLIIR